MGSERAFEKPLQTAKKPMKIYESSENPTPPEYLWKPLKTIPLQGPLRNPLRDGIVSLRTSQASTDYLAGILGCNMITDNTTRNSESKMALWEGLGDGIRTTSPNR